MGNSKINDGQEIETCTASYYIDERLQQVLGHCRLYFQDVPLEECDGVRFGKYGSFLSDCLHSPCNSPFQDISQHVLSYNISKFPQPVPLNNGGTTSCGGLKLIPGKNVPDSITNTSMAEGNSARHNTTGKGLVTSAADQYNHVMPNKRIKRSAATLTTSKNKNIYQSLGLDMSPSSSEGDSPICERDFMGSERGQTSSPAYLIEIMTTPPILEDDVILSPLPDNLMSLVEMLRKEDTHSCGSVGRNKNPLVGRNETHRVDTAKRRANEKYPSHYRSQSDTAFPQRRGKSVPRLDNSYDSHLRSQSIRPVQNQYSPIVCKSSQDKIYRRSDMAISSPVELPILAGEANNHISEADDLEHCANSLKSSGLQIESTEIFFQAALKYLNAASLLETHISGTAKTVELTPSKIYDNTAKLLEYCAQEYESCKDMACAALAYKCLEASNMQIVYSTDDNARRDCQELQVSLQSLTSGIASLVTDPSNSNIKNQKYMEKNDVPNDSSSSQLAESYLLDSRSQSMFVQLLNFTRYANSAMEASRKSQITFGYASKVLEEAGSTEIVDCIKRALSYGFHDMKKLLYLVYEAIEALGS